ncbi:hypothetical protein ACWNYI_00320 [Candidatus Vidania fulgoroideorum]
MITKYYFKIKKKCNIIFWLYDKNNKKKILSYKGKVVNKRYNNHHCNFKVYIKYGKYFVYRNFQTNNPFFLHYYIY